MQASRTPVREALHRLEVEGVVTRLRRRGFAVPPSSTAARDELLELKAVLEGYAVRLFCEQITPEALAVVRGILGRAETALRSGNCRLAARWHWRFHAYLSRWVTPRKHLGDELARITEQLMRYREAEAPSEIACQHVASQHKKILVALELGDPEVCERLMRAHVHGEDPTACLAPLPMRGALHRARDAREAKRDAVALSSHADRGAR